MGVYTLLSVGIVGLYNLLSVGISGCVHSTECGD